MSKAAEKRASSDNQHSPQKKVRNPSRTVELVAYSTKIEPYEWNPHNEKTCTQVLNTLKFWKIDGKLVSDGSVSAVWLDNQKDGSDIFKLKQVSKKKNRKDTVLKMIVYPDEMHPLGEDFYGEPMFIGVKEKYKVHTVLDSDYKGDAEMNALVEKVRNLTEIKDPNSDNTLEIDAIQGYIDEFEIEWDGNKTGELTISETEEFPAPYSPYFEKAVENFFAVLDDISERPKWWEKQVKQCCVDKMFTNFNENWSINENGKKRPLTKKEFVKKLEIVNVSIFPYGSVCARDWEKGDNLMYHEVMFEVDSEEMFTDHMLMVYGSREKGCFHVKL